MSQPHRPRRGSLAFSPRVRAKSEVPRVRAWLETDSPSIQGFAGYKVGMTHIMMVDDHPKSITTGMELSVPVTIIETPPMKVAAVRAYRKTSFGPKAAGEVWGNVDEALAKCRQVSKNHDAEAATGKISELIANGEIEEIRVVAYTNPVAVSGIPKKKPDVMEIKVGGNDVSASFEYATSMIGFEFSAADTLNDGGYVDISAITQGYGTQGPVKRWGIQLAKGKHSRQGSLRQIGTLGPWNPSHINWKVPQLGQTGYHQRTEYNKRVLKIGEDGSEVTPSGGFTNYGVVRNSYIMIKGSVPGPSKRLVRLRGAIRSNKIDPTAKPQIKHISTQSQQG